MANKSIAIPRSVHRISSYPLDESSHITATQLADTIFSTYKEYAEDMAANDGTTYSGQLITAENGDVFIVGDSNNIITLYEKDRYFSATKAYSAGDSILDINNEVMYAITSNGPGAFSQADWSYNKVINVSSDITLLEDFTVLCDTSISSLTLTMPNSPLIGSKILIIDSYGTADVNNISVDFSTEGYTGGLDTNAVGVKLMDTKFATCELTFIGGAIGWMQTGGNVITSELLE